MHSHFYYAKTVEAYNYDYSSDRAIWAISLVHYWCTHVFQVANYNGLCFNAYPMGLAPDGSLCLYMVLYNPRTETYVNNNASICIQQDINIQILYSLSPSCMLYNPIFNITMIAVSPHMFIIGSVYMYISFF